MNKKARDTQALETNQCHMASLYIHRLEREWNAFCNKSSFDIATRSLFFPPSATRERERAKREVFGRRRRSEAIICILITQLLFNTILIIFHFHYH